MQRPPETLSKEIVLELYCKMQRLKIEGAQMWLPSLDSPVDSSEVEVTQALNLVGDLHVISWKL